MYVHAIRTHLNLCTLRASMLFLYFFEIVFYVEIGKFNRSII